MLNYPPRVSLARLPTPLHECRNVSDLLRPGQRLWVKRDDETGCVTTGNKLRKLEYYVAEAERLGADTLITAGSALSNHCRTTAIVARQRGMDVALLLRGPERPALDGNFLLMALAGAMIRAVPADAPRDDEAQLQDMAQRLRDQGRHPYIVPPAGSGGETTPLSQNPQGGLECVNFFAVLCRPCSPSSSRAPSFRRPRLRSRTWPRT